MERPICYCTGKVVSMTARPEPTLRKRKSEEVKNRVYAAALAVIGEKGFEGATILGITKRANVTIGTFYHHFRSKDGVLEEAFIRADAGFELYAASPESRAGTIDERILRYFDRYADLVAETGYDLTKHFYTYRNTQFTRKGRRMQTGLEEMLEEARQAGQLAGSMTASEICDFLFVTARGVVFHWCLIHAAEDIHAMLRKHLSLIVPIFIA